MLTVVIMTTTTTPPASTGSMSLDGSTIDVQSSGEAQVKLACTGTGACAGKVTLSAKATAKKGKGGKKAKAATETIGTATFSIPPGVTAIIELKLSTPGRALQSAAHGRLSAALTVLKSLPSPSQTNTDSVHLVQRRAHGKTKK